MTDRDRRDTPEFRADLVRIALPFLVERLGGDVLITEAEYDEFMKRHSAMQPPAVTFERTPEGMRLSVPPRSN
jgi:hypothetical protein